jgi:EAL domain
MGEPGRDTSGVTTRVIVLYVREHGGGQAVAALLARARETRSADEHGWSSYEQKIRLFRAAVEVLGGPGRGPADRAVQAAVPHRPGRLWDRLLLPGAPPAVSGGRAIVQFGQTMGLTTVAEGVETADQAAVLRELGCGYGQG